jgi:hypothetical protein
VVDDETDNGDQYRRVNSRMTCGSHGTDETDENGETGGGETGAGGRWGWRAGPTTVDAALGLVASGMLSTDRGLVHCLFRCSAGRMDAAALPGHRVPELLTVASRC